MARAIAMAIWPPSQLAVAAKGHGLPAAGSCSQHQLTTPTKSSTFAFGRNNNYTISRTRRSSSSLSTNNQHYDVVIAGGGAVGSVLARLLLDDSFGSLVGGVGAPANTNTAFRRPLKVALLEQRSSPPSLETLVGSSDSNSQSSPPPNKTGKLKTPNPRAYALSPTSLSYLGPFVLQSLVKHNRCGVYDSMQIWEHDGPAQLHFAGEDLSGAVEDGRLVNLDSLLKQSEESNNINNKQSDNDVVGKQQRRPWLGAVVEDAPLVASIWDELRNDDRIDLLDNLQIKSIVAPSSSAMGKVEPPSPVELSFVRTNGDQAKEEECTVSANLLVAADGANSMVRRTTGNFPMMTRSYGRKAVTCTVELASGMAQTAFQRFLPHGPIALLPVWNSSSSDQQTKDGDGPIYANVVWSTTPSEANYLLSLSPTEFTSVLNQHLCQGPNVNSSILSSSTNGNSLPSIPLLSTIAREADSLLRTANTALTMGTWTESPSRNYFRMPPKSIGVIGPILGFDLSMSHVTTSGHFGSKNMFGGYTAPRVALVGDAAHTMHPMAGQGLNLGMSDVNSLAILIKEAVDSGMDVGGTELFLDRYNEDRMLKGWGTVSGVHGLHEIFGCSGSVPGSVADGTYDRGLGNAPASLQSLIGYSRSLGMNVVNSLPFVRRTLAEVAAGATPKGL